MLGCHSVSQQSLPFCVSLKADAHWRRTARIRTATLLFSMYTPPHRWRFGARRRSLICHPATPHTTVLFPSSRAPEKARFFCAPRSYTHTVCQRSESSASFRQTVCVWRYSCERRCSRQCVYTLFVGE